MKPSKFLLMIVTLCTLLLFAVSASAQAVDLGNDGTDMSCEGFPEFNAANGYFLHDGGSAERNVDNVDPDGDGIPCNEMPDNADNDGASVSPGLGNDGVDMNCDDFPERNAVEGYFAQDGGSDGRNVDGLDPDGDGVPCNEENYDAPAEEDNDPEDETPADDSANPGPVTSLPSTGSGPDTREGAAGLYALVATLIAIAGSFAFSVLRRAVR